MTALTETVFRARPSSFRRGFWKIFQRDKYLYLIFALPFFYLLIFQYIPMYGLVLAFKDFDVSKGILDSPWVGLKHFQEFFSNNYSYKLIWNTVMLRMWHLVFGFPVPIILALLLNELTNEKFKRFVQSSSYLPHFISVVVVCGMIVSFLASDGLVSEIVKFFGGKPYPWLMSPEWFRPIWLVSGIWQEAGWTSVIYLAALTAINLELYEAAAIDGANRWQRLIHITIPGILPTVMVLLLLRVGQFLAMDYQKVLLLYTGATYETADILGTYIYRRGILGADFSFATAVGLFQSLVGLVFIVTCNWISKKTTETSLW